MSAGHKINCRARVHKCCYHGRSTAVQFGEALGMDEDGTFDGESIICDPCYMRLIPITPSGMGLHYEFDGAIRAARRR